MSHTQFTMALTTEDRKLFTDVSRKYELPMSSLIRAIVRKLSVDPIRDLDILEAAKADVVSKAQTKYQKKKRK